VLLITIRGGLELCFGGRKRTKDPPPRSDGTVAKLQLAFNALDSEKYFRYTICQACKICQTFCL